MCQMDRAVDLVGAMVASVKVPVTVKMRLGWDDESLTAPGLARAFEQVGCRGRDHPRPDAGTGIQGLGEPRGDSRGGRGSRSDPGGRQRRHPHDRRRRPDVRRDRLRGRLDRPWCAGQSLLLPPARPLGPHRRPRPGPVVRRADRPDVPTISTGWSSAAASGSAACSSARSSSGTSTSRGCRARCTSGCSTSRAVALFDEVIAIARADGPESPPPSHYEVHVPVPSGAIDKW